MEKFENPINKKDIQGVPGPDGILRKSLAYNEDALLCNFDMKKGAKIPLHNHKHAQIGYVINGKLKFITEDGSFLAETGDSYVFDGYEKHGAEILEDSDVIEAFTPCRKEYIPE